MKSSSVEFKKKKCEEWLWCLSAMKTLEATCSKQAFDEATYIHKRLFCHTCRTCSPLSDLLSAAVLGITAESDWIKRSALEWRLSTLLLLFLIFSSRKVAGIQCAANKNTVFQQGNKRRKRTTIYSKVTNYYKHTKRSCLASQVWNTSRLPTLCLQLPPCSFCSRANNWCTAADTWWGKRRAT